VLFDAYGTLFDVFSIGARAIELWPEGGAALAPLWRDKQLEYTRLLSMGGRYRPFTDITAAALRFACARLGLPLSAAAEEALMDEYGRLAMYPENAGVLAALKARGVRTGILSNGDPALLTRSVQGAGIAGLVDPVLSVEPVRRFKPDPAVYALGPAALGVAAADILLVSSNGWDAIGAAWAGYRTLWVNRLELPLEQLGTEPERTGTTLADVLDFFPS
jgi:2-haloacid dehalogenase